MKYAIFVPCDQTIAYLSDESGRFTTKRASMRLFDSKEAAHEAWRDVQVSEKHDAPLVDAGPKAYAGDHGGYLEEVPDEAAFRAEGDTW